MDINHRIARRVRDLRDAQGLSLDALAERSGVSRSNISLIERAQSKRGAVVSTSLYETALTWMSIPIAGYQASRNIPRAYGSGVAVAQASGRDLVLVWSPDHHCDCRFDDLFEPAEGVTVVESDDAVASSRLRRLTYMEIEPGACKDAWDGILNSQLDYRHRPCNFVEIMPRLDEHLKRGKAQASKS